MLEISSIDSFFKKLIGWFLLIVGLVVIFWAGYSSFNIFTNRKAVPEVFKMEQKETECPPCEAIRPGSTQEEIQRQIERLVEGQLKEQIREFIPPEAIIKIFNLLAWGIFAAIMIFAGVQVAGLGIRLMRVR